MKMEREEGGVSEGQKREREKREKSPLHKLLYLRDGGGLI